MLTDVVQQIAIAELLKTNTAMPAEVVRVDVARGQVDVQPLIMKRYADQSVVRIPVVTNVPLAIYRAGGAFISLPVKVGHTVLLICAQRSLDRWLSTGGAVDPADPRRFSINDAMAYPGVYPFTDPPVGADPDAIVIKNQVAELRVKPDGRFQLTNGQDEVVDLLVQLAGQLASALQTLSADTTNTMLGPMKLNSFSQYATLGQQVATIQGKLGNLKG